MSGLLVVKQKKVSEKLALCRTHMSCPGAMV